MDGQGAGGSLPRVQRDRQCQGSDRDVRYGDSHRHGFALDHAIGVAEGGAVGDDSPGRQVLIQNDGVTDLLGGRVARYDRHVPNQPGRVLAFVRAAAPDAARNVGHLFRKRVDDLYPQGVGAATVSVGKRE